MTQVTQCYKVEKRWIRAALRASSTLLLALVVAGCGSAGMSRGTAPMFLHARDLPEWKAVADAPGIAELAPRLDGLTVTGQADSPALVRGGDAVRASTFAFECDRDAREALARAKAADYAPALEKAFRGNVVGRTAGPRRVGYRLTVPRPAEPGDDTVELYVIRRGRAVALVEFVSAGGFDPKVRAEILSR
jgi:hypothetical protein